MPKKVYEEEENIALYVVTHVFLLPFKILSIVPKALAAALRLFLRAKGHDDIGISIDPDNDGVWLRKYKR